MGQLIRFIFIAIMVFWVIRMLIRLVLPMLFGRVANKMNQQPDQQRNRKPEGSISIEYMPPKTKHGNADKLGDFVDYEEVKE